MSSASESEPVSILCYGDSNTWGFVPGEGSRYPFEHRWTGVLQAELGPGCRVIEEGLNGRTTVREDPAMPGRNGKEYLGPCLESHRPLDLVILLLGTNDCKKQFSASSHDIARGIALLIRMIQVSGAGPGGGPPAILLLAPPHIGKLTGFSELFEDGADKSRKLGPRLQALAAETGCAYLDTGTVIQSSDVDGIHLDRANQTLLGKAVSLSVRSIPSIRSRYPRA